MEIRAARRADLKLLIDLDATIESAEYLHVDRQGEGFSGGWTLEPRRLRQTRIDRNPLTDEAQFALRQVTSGADEGLVLLAEHEQIGVALLIARVDPEAATLRVIDARVDFEHRRQGIGSAMLFRVIAEARDRKLRAVSAETQANNFPAACFLAKSGFELTGLDTRRRTNHDLVREAVTLFWHASLD